MNQRLTRRRFGQIAIASTTVAGLGYLANKTFAQMPAPTTSLRLIGVSAGATTGNANARVAQGITAASSSTTDGLIVQTLDLATGQVQNLSSQFQAAIGSLTQSEASSQNAGTSTQQPVERLTSLSAQSNGTLVVSSTPLTTASTAPPSRLRFLGTSPQQLNVSGLASNDSVESVLVTNDGSILALVGRRKDTPPFRLANINPQSGQVSFINNFSLPADQWFGNLAQCPNGTIYAINVTRQGNTNLVRLDQSQGQVIIVAPISFQGTTSSQIGVNSPIGLRSLACSTSGQLFALGAPRYESVNSLYTLDANTGVLSLLRQFDTTKITFAPV